ncbi:MAG: gamma-glutamyltransferase family protein, partial [Acetobacteraceae bacterium]|nr:gamma-glutamyltransferase family protein [Acetobacteraceae bacterium]
SGLGGDGFYHVYIAAGGTALVYNGTGPAPHAAQAAAFPAGIEVYGPRSISVPGSLGALDAMHRAHGSRLWAKLAEPAIAHATEGFAATHGYRHFAAENRPRLVADPRSRATFLEDGSPPALGSLIRQPELAGTLSRIAAEGADTFYRGAIARELAAGLQQAGALVSAADLASFRPEVQTPIAAPYRGFEVRQTPPNSTGFVLLQMLRIAERFDLARLPPADRIHVLVEAKKRAFMDRERFGADPAFEPAPIAHLLSDETAASHAAAISLERAADLPLQFPEPAAADTTYFCVVDAAGNAVSGIQSINSAFGSGVTAGETGVLMNNRMAYWHLDGRHPNRLQPGKRVRHTMNAPMVFKDGRLWAVLGTPGADNQVQVNLQVLTAMIDLEADPQTAIELPRWTSSQPGQGANWPHEGDGALTIEMDAGEAVLTELERRGHRLKRVGPLEGPCAMQAIRVQDNGVRMAGSDTRRDGWAAAY